MDALTEALIDLAYTPDPVSDAVADLLMASPAYLTEARDKDGKWTGHKVGLGVVKKAPKKPTPELLSELEAAMETYEFGSMFGGADPAPVKNLLASHPELLASAKGREMVAGYSELSGIKPTYKEASEEYGWPALDKDGGLGTPANVADMHTEHQSQINATYWHDSVTPQSSDEDQYAASLWEQYQNPSMYEPINQTLRTGKAVPGGPTKEVLMQHVNHMFEKAGTTLDRPVTVYRAVHGKDHDWPAILKPGSTFTDEGFMSTTAHPRFAQGWLALDAKGNETDKHRPNDVVLEIRLPKGERVVGGSEQFIEMMLHPGTTLKIISSEKRRADKARNPLTGHDGETEDPFDYTHVIAEAVRGG